MFTATDYHDLTPNSRRAIAKLADFTCPADCKHCPFYSDDVITVNYELIIKSLWRDEHRQFTHEGHCIINAARVEFPDWRYE